MLLILAALAIGNLTPEQAGALTAVAGLLTALIPYLPRGGR